MLTSPVWAIVTSRVFTALPPSPFPYGFSDYDGVMSQCSASSLLPRRQASSVALFTPAKRMVRSRQTIDGVTPNPLVTLGAVPEARYQDAARQPHRWQVQIIFCEACTPVLLRRKTAWNCGCCHQYHQVGSFWPMTTNGPKKRYQPNCQVRFHDLVEEVR